MSTATTRRVIHRHLSMPHVAQTLLPLEPGRMWIDPAYREHLERAGLTTLAAVMQTAQGRMLRRLPDRENWRIELRDSRNMLRRGYLKRHHGWSLRNWLRAKLGHGPGLTAGRAEAFNIIQLTREKIATMRIIAWGEQLSDNGTLESFVLTEELIGCTQLDHFLRTRFGPLAEETVRDADFERLLREVAGMARRFHELGYNHRDLYCCHFFVREDLPGHFQVRLIDLQRVERRQRFRERWVIKDLAQLSYSAPVERVSRSRRMAFFKHYLGVRKLTSAHKRLARRVLAKHAQIERREGPHP